MITQGQLGSKRTIRPGVIEITMHEAAIGKPRMTRQDKWVKRKPVVDYRNWSQVLKLVAGILPDPNIISRLSWTAIYAIPKTWTKKKQKAYLEAFEAGKPKIKRTVPDRDNIDKAILDTLFGQDSGVGVGTIGKYWGPFDRLVITIEVDENS